MRPVANDGMRGPKAAGGRTMRAMEGHSAAACYAIAVTMCIVHICNYNTCPPARAMTQPLARAPHRKLPRPRAELLHWASGTKECGVCILRV
eukprot:scaffold5141_cov150-Isochrysis_galbana.AAC.3